MNLELFQVACTFCKTRQMRKKRDYNKCVLVPQTVGQLVCCMYLYSLLVLDINRLSNKTKPFIPCVGIWPGSAMHTGLILGLNVYKNF